MTSVESLPPCDPPQLSQEGDGFGEKSSSGVKLSCVTEFPISPVQYQEPVYHAGERTEPDKSPLEDVTLAEETALRERLRQFATCAVSAGSVNVQLRVQARAKHRDVQKVVSILIDTGAEVSLVKKDLFPASCLQRAAKPVRLTTANASNMSGGQQEALLTLEFDAVDKTSGSKVTISTPCLLYEADIAQDVIVSYAWLAVRNFDVCPNRHGVQGTIKDCIVWIPGVSGSRSGLAEVRSMRAGSEWVQAVGTGPKRALDLFSGIGSATRVLQQHGYTVTTLDADPKYQADIVKDIREWDPVCFPPEYFDIIVACPPCTEYSRAMTKRPRQLEEADSIVRRTL